MAEQKSTDKTEFSDRDFVQLHGLSTDCLNGKIGTIESFDKQSNRYIVIVNGNRMRIKSINLNPVTPYKASKIENKGMGLIANKCNLKAGDIILQENMWFGFKKNEAFTLQSIVSKFNKLSQKQQSRYMTLSHHADEKQNQDVIIQQIYINNRVENEQCVADDSYTEGLLPTFSLLNHCCIPNAFCFFDQNSRQATQIVVALKDIAKHEEIVTSYLGGFYSFEERQRKLFNTWKFSCLCTVCTVCSKDKEFQIELDTAYARYNDLEARLRNVSLQLSVGQKIKICVEMIRMLNGKQMMNEPRIMLSKIYMYLAQYYIQLKDWENAIIYINKSIQNDMVYYNKFMDWSQTNFVIKSISNKYMKQNANNKFKKWSHVKGLKIPFLNDKKKTRNYKKKRRR